MSSLKQHSGRRTGLLKYLLVTIAISLSALQMAAAVGEVSGPQTLALASHSTGSSWNVYASAMAGMFRDALPPGKISSFQPEMVFSQSFLMPAFTKPAFSKR